MIRRVLIKLLFEVLPVVFVWGFGIWVASLYLTSIPALMVGGVITGAVSSLVGERAYPKELRCT